VTKSRFDIEYNKWLQQINVEEGDNVWNEIENELDFIETWDNISAKLDEVKPQKGKIVPIQFLKLLAASAAILLILFFPIRYFMLNERKQPNISEFKGENDINEETTYPQIIPLNIDDEENFIQLEETEIPIENKLSKLPSKASLVNESESQLINKDYEFNKTSSERVYIEKIKTIAFNAYDLIANNESINHYTLNSRFKPSHNTSGEKVKSIRIAQVGLVYGYKNTWLLNHETTNALYPQKLGRVLPTFHQDFGVTSTLVINNRHSFDMEFLWKSEAGQDYKQYINASYTQRNINLDYLKFQAFYLWDINKRIPGQIIVGGYFARLRMAIEQQDNVRLNVYENYCDLDYGILSGYQFNVPLGKRVILKPSLRFSYNLLNIFEGDDITPSYFKRTKNFSAGFNISLSYRFSK